MNTLQCAGELLPHNVVVAKKPKTWGEKMKAKQNEVEKEKTIFQDSQNRTYNIRITILTIDAIRDRLGIDITEPQDLLTVSLDPVKICRVVFACVEKQVEAQGLTESEFYESMDGDSWESAAEAMLEAYVNFCPPRRREMIRLAVNNARTAEAELVSRITKRQNELNLNTVISDALDGK